MPVAVWTAEMLVHRGTANVLSLASCSITVSIPVGLGHNVISAELRLVMQALGRALPALHLYMTGCQQVVLAI